MSDDPQSALDALQDELKIALLASLATQNWRGTINANELAKAVMPTIINTYGPPF